MAKNCQILSKKIIIAAIALGILLLALTAWRAWQMVGQNNLKPDQGKICLKVYPGDSFENVTAQLQPYLQRPGDFKTLARLRHLDRHIRTGYYELGPEASNRSLLAVLTQGLQKPVKLQFNNVRTLPQLAGILSHQIMLDSAQIMAALTDSVFLQRNALSLETLPALFLPDTYEVWWNMSPERLCQLFERTWHEFWTERRLQAAQSQGLSPIEVSIIASIVEEETNAKDEWPIVAGIYLNRLRRGMYLQACPTVKFALQDFSIKRVLKEHTEVDSPYNTYQHLGLPPGPVRIPSKAALEAVLAAPHHNYLYMCAKDDFSGHHYFSTNLRQHNAYAQRYHQALNKNRIYR